MHMYVYMQYLQIEVNHNQFYRDQNSVAFYSPAMLQCSMSMYIQCTLVNETNMYSIYIYNYIYTCMQAILHSNNTVTSWLQSIGYMYMYSTCGNVKHVQ